MKNFVKLFFIFFLFNSSNIIIASASQVEIEDDNDDRDDDTEYSNNFEDADEIPGDTKLNSSTSSNNINLSGTSDHGGGSLHASPSSSNGGSSPNLNDITGVSVEDVTDRDDDYDYVSDDENNSGADSSSGTSSGSNSPDDMSAASKFGSQPSSNVNTSNDGNTGSIPLGAAAAHSSANNQAPASGTGLQSNGHSVGPSSTGTNSNDVNDKHLAASKTGAHDVDDKHVANASHQTRSTSADIDYDQPAILPKPNDGSTNGTATTETSGQHSSSPKTDQDKQDADYANNAGNSLLNKIKEGLLSKPYLTGLAAAAAISGIIYKYNANVRKKVDNVVKTAKEKAQKAYAQFSQFANRPFKVSSALKIGAVCGAGYLGYKLFESSGLQKACTSIWNRGFWERDRKEKLLIGSSIVATGISAALIYNAVKNRKNKNKEKAVQS